MKYFQLPQPHNLWNNIKHSAFTLVELSITLALVLIILSISLPVMLNYHHFYVATQARTLQTTCWALQQQAIAQNKQISLEFNESNNSFFMNHEKTKLSPNVKFGFIPTAHGPPSNPQQPLTSSITFADKKIIFYPNGRISPGSVYLVDDTLQTLYAITIPVSSVSYIRVYRYHDPHWQLCT